jgi:hypothetical protein
MNSFINNLFGDKTDKIQPHKKYHPPGVIFGEPKNYNKLFDKSLKYLHSLDVDTKEAIRYYTSNAGFENINNVLRGVKCGNKVNVLYTTNAIKLLDIAFLNAPPLKHDIVLYRGIHLYNYLHTNLNFIDKGYLSTSLDINIAHKFNHYKKTKCCLFEIHIPKGTRILPLTPFSHFTKEYEVLLPRNGEFQLVKNNFTPKKNTTIVKYIQHL